MADSEKNEKNSPEEDLLGLISGNPPPEGRVPEEKLLDIINGDNVPGGGTGASGGDSPAGETAPEADRETGTSGGENWPGAAPKPEGQNFSSALPEGSGLSSDFFKMRKSTLTLRNLNILLFLSLLAALFHLLAISLESTPRVSDIAVSVAKIDYDGFPARDIRSPEPVERYKAAARERDIFRPGHAVGEAPAPAAAAAAEQEIRAELEKYALVGIYRGADREAMIESSEKERTYFLKEGDSFEGITVMKILQDRVVVEKEGVEVELL